MIGIHVKNQLLAENLRTLYPQQVEIFHLKKNYSGLITDETPPDFKGAILYINCPHQALNLNTPFSLKEFEEALNRLERLPIELKFYFWQRKNRQLINKKTQKKINLTQKEEELIDFLWHTPQHLADKETLLNEVWHYHKKAQTHTLTTHLFDLKQKLGEKAPPLIEFKKNQYHLL